MSRKRGRRGGQGGRGGGGYRPPGQTTHQLQAESEGVPLMQDGKISLRGRWFRASEETGSIALLAFAKFASQGVDARDMRGLARIYDMLKDAIYDGRPACGRCRWCTGDPPMPTRCDEYEPGDWEAFYQHALDTKARPDELLAVVRAVIQGRSAFPTVSPSGSESGSAPTSPSSRDTSSPAGTGSSMPQPPGGFIDIADLQPGS